MNQRDLNGRCRLGERRGEFHGGHGIYETLSRVIRVPSSTRGIVFRNRPKVGMTKHDWPALYDALTPVLDEDIALHRYASCLAAPCGFRKSEVVTSTKLF